MSPYASEYFGCGAAFHFERGVDVFIAALDALAAGECELPAAGVHDDGFVLAGRPDEYQGVVVS